MLRLGRSNRSDTLNRSRVAFRDSRHLGPLKFWNAGPGPARLLEVIAPAGFEVYFAELAEAGDPGRREELAAKYGVTYSSDWVAELTSRYNLKLLGQ